MNSIQIKKKWMYSLALNLAIVLMIIVAIILWKLYQSDGWLTLRYFTIQSNWLMGAVSLAYSIYLILIMKGKIKKIPHALEIAKLLSTTGVTLTLIIAVLFLGPVARDPMLFIGCQVFYHLLVPLTSIATFLLFEHSDNGYRLPDTIYALLHMLIYATYYATAAFAHMQNGVIVDGYDWYTFISIFTVRWCWICILLMIGITYLIAWLLWLGSKKINLFDKKPSVNLNNKVEM